MEADSGLVSFSQGLRLGYLEQNPKFNETDTIYEAILANTDDPEDPDSIALTWELYSKPPLVSTCLNSLATSAPSRPSQSNTKRSKLLAFEISIEGLEVCKVSAAFLAR